eukprot:2365860-Heterocapsa_arctica.AAC.1
MPVLRLEENSDRGIGEFVVPSTRSTHSPPQRRIQGMPWGTIEHLNVGCSLARCRGGCYTTFRGALTPWGRSRRT